MKLLSKLLLRIVGWRVVISVPDYPKCIICVAPHTSNWDFILGKLAYLSVGRKAGFLMKETWFFFPLGLIFKAIGGIPVPRKRGSSLVESIIVKFNSADRMALAITPEGTRSKVSQWRSGFLHIAREANVPILLGKFDFKEKYIYVTDEFTMSGDVERDIQRIKDYYKGANACYPEKFTTE